MKQSVIVSIFVLLLSCFFSPLIAAEAIEGGYEPVGGSTMRQLDDLIEVTQANLSELRDLRQQVIEYQKIKAKYMANQQDKEQIIRMVKAASRLQQSIQAQNLSHAFDAETVKELAFFSQIANKKGIPRP